MSEKYVLVRKELHLGYIKETFRAGAVLEYDEAKRTLVVDGRKFNEVRDIEVLKRQAERDPDGAWIVPWSKEAVEQARASVPAPAPKRAVKPGEHMQVVRSDADLMDSEIDIRDTQVSKKTAAAKEAARAKVKKEGMPVIRGDETVEERIAALKGKNDINSVAERVRLKQAAAKMPVVQDDSLGSNIGGSRAAALNAGQKLPSREEVEAKTAAAKAAADARKRDAEAKRPAVVQDGSDDEGGGVALLDAESTPTGAPRAVSGGKGKRTPVRNVKTAKRLVAAEG